jgi:threonine dehydrogenase-like Zn-dependent dehydrogenase
MCFGLKPGQRYAVIPCVPCGECVTCREGKTNCCERVSLYGVHQDGGFSEYLAVRAENLVALLMRLATALARWLNALLLVHTRYDVRK